MTDYEDNHYQYKVQNSRKHKHNKLSSSHNQHYYQSQMFENANELKIQNVKLKKQLKQTQAKRVQITKQCSEYQKKIQILQQKITQLNKTLQQGYIDKQGDRYRVQELKFLNKQLSSEVQELRQENQDLAEKLRYSHDVVEKKYEELEEKTFKRIEQAMKRVKKSVHYLQTLSIKQIQKTRQILIENLKKANQLLKGKFAEDVDAEIQIMQLMNPLKNIQEQLAIKSRELNQTKTENVKLQEQVKKHKKIQKELLPQYKDAIQSLKKSLGQVRSQLSQNQYEKAQLKKRYEQKIKTLEIKYNQLFTEYRKNKLQKHIYENKLQQLQNQAQQQKQRLIGQNQILKKLYERKSQQAISSSREEFYQMQNYDNYDDSQDDSQVRDNINNVQGYRQKNLRRKKQQYQVNKEDQMSENLSVNQYNSADYYNIKPTRPTFQDEPKDRRFLKKNQSSKDLNYIREQRNSRSKLAIHDNYSKSRTKYKKYQKYQKTKPNYKHNIPINQQNHNIHKNDISYNDNNEQQQIYNNNNNEYYIQNESHAGYQQENSMLSQESLKNQICKIDQEIMEIQKNLNKQLEAYK